MSRWSHFYVPEIETGRHVKNNACTVEIKIKWMIRKHMTYESTYRDDMHCISSASERKHEIACTSWSSCLRKLCELVSNIEEQLCIVLMYTGILSIIFTISQFESDSKMCTFNLISSAFVYDVWATDLGFCQEAF